MSRYPDLKTGRGGPGRRCNTRHCRLFPGEWGVGRLDFGGGAGGQTPRASLGRPPLRRPSGIRTADPPNAEKSTGGRPAGHGAGTGAETGDNAGPPPPSRFQGGRGWGFLGPPGDDFGGPEGRPWLSRGLSSAARARARQHPRSPRTGPTGGPARSDFPGLSAAEDYGEVKQRRPREAARLRKLENCERKRYESLEVSV